MIHARLTALVEQVVKDQHVLARLGRAVSATELRYHQRGRSWQFAQIYCSGDDPGQIGRNSIVVPPRPHRASGTNQTPPLKGFGEPCAEEPHARFDGRRLETEPYGVTSPAPTPASFRASDLISRKT